MENNYFEISKKAKEHLDLQDPLVGRLIKKAGSLKREIVSDPFTALVQSIVFQQLAYAAANTIWKRLLDASKNMTPKSISEMSFESLRSCGLSGSKANYIQNIADAFISKSLTDDKLLNSSDKDVVDMLIEIKGIGQWTAEMFLIFCLMRENVFSYKDLGLRKGVMWLYGLKDEPSKQFCDSLVKRWSPYSSIVSLYLWEITIKNFFGLSANTLLYPFLKSETEEIDYYDSPIGVLKIITSSKGLKNISFENEKTQKKSNNKSPLMKMVKTELYEYFNGTRNIFDIPLDFNGTDFQKDIWQVLRTIDYGTTTTYGNIAKKVGNEKASRAVGNANNKNKIPIIVPCHRVVGASGSLTGYAGGLEIKRWLLNHELKYKD